MKFTTEFPNQSSQLSNTLILVIFFWLKKKSSIFAGWEIQVVCKKAQFGNLLNLFGGNSNCFDEVLFGNFQLELFFSPINLGIAELSFFVVKLPIFEVRCQNICVYEKFSSPGPKTKAKRIGEFLVKSHILTNFFKQKFLKKIISFKIYFKMISISSFFFFIS